MARSLAVCLLALAAACGGRRPPPPAPLFPLAAAWTARLADFVVSPLAADSRRVYVATRDGALTALDHETGGVAWRVQGLEGWPSSIDGRLVVRNESGTVWSLRPRDGEVRWKVETGVSGHLPATLDGDRLYVAGRGLVALDAETGRALWTWKPPAEITASPVATSVRLLAGDASGTLHCLDRAAGVSLWEHRTAGPLLAPPLVDESRRRVYLGTTDQGILELGLERGRSGWRWKVGADIQAPGLLLPDRVLFAAFDAVLYGLHRGGSLAWRTALPSRPLGGPALVRGHIVVACHENEILGFLATTGRSAGSLRTAAEIRTPPLVAGPRILVGLRDRSVVAYVLPEPDTSDRPAGGASPAVEEGVERR